MGPSPSRFPSVLNPSHPRPCMSLPSRRHAHVGCESLGQTETISLPHLITDICRTKARCPGDRGRGNLVEIEGRWRKWVSVRSSLRGQDRPEEGGQELGGVTGPISLAGMMDSFMGGGPSPRDLSYTWNLCRPQHSPRELRGILQLAG